MNLFNSAERVSGWPLQRNRADSLDLEATGQCPSDVKYSK
jgi:hypothetical protein